jgi:hypothetical protein
MTRNFLLIVSFILVVIGFGPFVQAQGDSAVTTEDVRAFATPDGAQTGAVFMTIKNAGGSDDSLTAASTDASEITEIHENTIDPDNGRMMMREIDSIVVPANGQVVLEPTGKHLMLLKLKQSLKEGTNFNVTLTFEKAGALIVPVKVVPAGEAPSHHGHH